MIHLMNSAMMPVPGRYELKKMSKNLFVLAVQKAARDNILKSSIGYPQNAQIIEKLTGVRIALSRELTDIKSGDQMLIMRLQYRADRPKGADVGEEDFDFFHATYQL
ncbi:MAG: DUF1874 domain-containing protein [Saprospiraceae bacterium]|nr:DUF1874 domain-containing protein [Saprospiraceae bacterium]